METEEAVLPAQDQQQVEEEAALQLELELDLEVQLVEIEDHQNHPQMPMSPSECTIHFMFNHPSLHFKLQMYSLHMRDHKSHTSI